MKIHEYQAKEILREYGLPIPEGEVAKTPAEARDLAAKYGGKVVIKAQVQVAGRGKAGGIKLADGPEEAEEKAGTILGMDIKGIEVKKVLVGRAVDIKKEIYLGITIDRSQGKAVAMASAEGGIDIEEVAKVSPEKIIKVYVHPLLGFTDYQVRGLGFSLGLDKDGLKDFSVILRGLYQAFVDSDASLAEINPLAIDEGGRLVAVDAKMLIDDNALYRRKNLEAMRDLDEEDPYEREAREGDLSYVRLDGNIGCMVNGAGLAMATMDSIKLSGGEPANFLDIGGGAGAEKVSSALKIILSDSNVKVVLFNIFGGITRCDVVAQGIMAALDEIKPSVPMVVRLVGTNEEEGRRILSQTDMITASTLQEAATKAVDLSKG